MKAITVHEPYASLIKEGKSFYIVKDFDSKYSGPIAIHAGTSNDLNSNSLSINEKENIEKALGKDYKYHNGVIIAIAYMVRSWYLSSHSMPPNMFSSFPYYISEYLANIDEKKYGGWYDGKYAFQIQNVKVLDKPIPTKGHQRIWEWEIPNEVPVCNNCIYSAECGVETLLGCSNKKVLEKTNMDWTGYNATVHRFGYCNEFQVR